jgi:crotonobetainyl-CoA:carnitine CoA-transferase CaiB-like acyl-CoA transferase
MTGPCDDLRIIDLSSGRAAGIATMVLADFGADVIKVEPPGGDPERSDPSSPMWLRGKRSVTLDLETSDGQQRLHDLVRGADVVVASYPAGAAERHAADYATLSSLNAGLVYCSLTGWGLNGPLAQYPADDALVMAKTGRMAQMAGIARREGPTFSAVQVGVHAASQSAIAGILAALFARERTGKGQLVETSLLQGQIPFELQNLVRSQITAKYPERMAREAAPTVSATSMPTLGYQPFMAKDGRWIQFANLLEHLFQAQIVALELTEEILINPKYEGAPNRLSEEAREEVRNIMLERAKEKTADEWMEIFRQNTNVAADYVGTAQEALYHPDLVANGEIVEHEHPKLGTIRQLGPVAKLRETPGAAGGPAPEAGQHTAEVLAEAPRRPRTIDASPDSRPPLDGVTVLEFSTIIATPLSCSLLADMGARVIKIEPIGGDPGRGLARTGGISAYMGSSKLQASKESICIDLKAEEGQALVRKFIKDADFIINNYRPGASERLGIGYEQARAIKPDIIWINNSGYGPDGPGADRPGAHPIPGAVNGGALMQAGSGWPPADLSDINDLREASRQFSRSNEANPDPCTAVVIATSAMLALHAKQRTGKGQQVFVSMVGANAYANAEDTLSYRGKPDRPVLNPGLHGTSPLRRLYETKEGWILLVADTDAQWSALLEATERPDLGQDPRFKDAAARDQHRGPLIEALKEVFAEETADEWEQSLIPAGIGCVRADTYANVGQFFLKDEQARANGLTPIAEHIVLGAYQRHGPVVTFSQNPGRYGPGVIAGEQTDALLAEIGVGAEEAADLRARNIVWSEPAVVVDEPPAETWADPREPELVLSGRDR